jgi:hypothetical protein
LQKGEEAVASRRDIDSVPGGEVAVDQRFGCRIARLVISSGSCTEKKRVHILIAASTISLSMVAHLLCCRIIA